MPHTILFLHRGGSQIRGSEDALLTLLDGLDRTEFRPVVFHSDPVLSRPLAERGVEAATFEFPELMLEQGAPARLPLGRYLGALRRLRRECKARRVALLLSNGGAPCQLGLPVAKSLRRPLISYIHHPAPKDHHYCWLTPWVPTLVFASEFTAADTRSVTGRQGVVVSPGIDTARFAPVARRDPSHRRALGIAPDEIVFAQVGALAPHKGHALLLEAFERVARANFPVRLLVIGTGPMADALRSLAVLRGLSERVVFTGYVEDTLPYFQHVVDVNVLASREEGLGLVNLQASACGLPNVATDGTGIRETIVDGETGYLFPAGDAAALAGRMLRLRGDERQRRTMGAAGRRLVAARFSQELFCDRMQELFRRALRTPRVPARALGSAGSLEMLGQPVLDDGRGDVLGAG